MSYIKLVEVQQTEQATITGTTKGASDYDSRIARVFDETGNTIAHECAHALGLPHWFHTATDILAEIGRIAEARAPTIGIFSTEQLYLFHDASHVDGLEIVFNKRFSSSSPPTLASRVVTLRFLFFPRIYQMSQTDNLMDYQTNGLPAHQEQLRKHQVEQIRYFA
jgi:hypothetical protein